MREKNAAAVCGSFSAANHAINSERPTEVIIGIRFEDEDARGARVPGAARRDDDGMPEDTGSELPIGDQTASAAMTGTSAANDSQELADATPT